MADNTIFDDVFRTMLEKMPELVIPLINEVFGKNYPADIPITQMFLPLVWKTQKWKMTYTGCIFRTPA